MARRGAACALAVIAARLVLCAGDGSGDDGALDIITQHNHDRVLDGRKTLLVAFVAPLLPRSARLQPVLHELRRAFSGDPQLGVAFVDCSAERRLAAKYAVRDLPTLLVFPRRLPR